MAYPVNGEPDELGPEQPAPSRERALALLGRRDFRRTFLAVLVSEAGDAFHYVALMWVALVTAGPAGVLAVRLADSLPALVFGLHGGSSQTGSTAGERWSRPISSARRRSSPSA